MMAHSLVSSLARLKVDLRDSLMAHHSALMSAVTTAKMTGAHLAAQMAAQMDFQMAH